MLIMEQEGLATNITARLVYNLWNSRLLFAVLWNGFNLHGFKVEITRNNKIWLFRYPPPPPEAVAATTSVFTEYSSVRKKGTFYL